MWRPPFRMLTIGAAAVIAATLTVTYLVLSRQSDGGSIAVGVPTDGSMADGSAIKIVEEVVAAKLAAMQVYDLEAYMTLIDEGDAEYYTEQRNWFLIYQDADTSAFGIQVLEADFAEPGIIVARLRQHYLLGPQGDDRTIEYENRFVKTDAGWKDADLAFSILETAHFVIRHPARAARQAADAGEAAELAYASVTDKLGLEPQAKPTIKMYATKEMLRESSDIRIAYLFNGWGEAGESIKMYAYRSGDLPNLIAHELVHKITLEISGNQPSWFAEGLAMYFGNWPFAGGDPLQTGSSAIEDLARPISWLESNDLTQISDDRTRRTFYDMSGILVQFMAETYGRDRLHAVLNGLTESPDFDRGYDYSMEPELQRRLYGAIEAAVGVDRVAFNEAWLAWIAMQ